MQCQEIRQQMAVYRELNGTAQELVQEHLRSCPDCAVVWTSYQVQDRLLSTLPVISPSPGLAAAVRARTVDRSRGARRMGWGWASAALSTMLVVAVFFGTLSASAATLPGDTLYPVKRGAEQVRLALTMNTAARQTYQEQLVQTRLEEVQEVVQLQRQVAVEFQGRLDEITDSVWVLDGLPVRVPSGAWSGPAPTLGALVHVRAAAAAGQLEAVELRVESDQTPPSPSEPSPTALPFPTSSPTPSPTVSPKPSDTVTAMPGRPATRRPEQPSPTRTPPRGPDPSATPSPTGLGERPTARPSATRRRLQPSQTPRATRVPAVTTASPSPSRVPAQPTASPSPTKTRARPLATPGGSGPGPGPSPTPPASPPARRPSVTPGSGSPGAQPTSTNKPPTQGQPNSTSPPGQGGQGG